MVVAVVGPKIRSILAEQMAILAANVTDSSLLVEDLGADSLDLVEIVMEVEEQFSVTLPAEFACDTNTWTVHRLIDYVSTRVDRRS